MITLMSDKHFTVSQGYNIYILLLLYFVISDVLNAKGKQ